jgi:peptide/nickel transport system substrate-binding protein
VGGTTGPRETAVVRLALVLLVGASLLGTGCTRVETAAGDQQPWTKPGVLRIADIADPDHFNPLLSGMDLVANLSSLVFSYLVVADGAGRLVGDLATEVPSLQNGGISLDGRTYTYHLRRGVLWHDGVRLTSHDVAFTWQVVVNPRNNVFHREGYTEIDRIETPDDVTVVVHLKRRYPPFVTKFFAPLQEGPKAILPEHLLARLPEINTAAFNAAPIGSGPFKFVRWDRGRGIELVANEHYFRGRPKVDRIEFTVIPDDNTLMNEMSVHHEDLLQAATTLYERYQHLAGVVATLTPWNALNILALNNKRPGLRHLEVRQAIALAVDYSAIIAKVTHGVGVVAHDILPPTAIGYTDNPPYRHDPKAAAELLERNGWRPGAGGIRARGGERLDFVMTISTGSANGRNIAVQVQQMLRDVGIGVTLKTYPYNIIFAYDGPIFSGKYDFADYSYTLGFDPDNLAYLGCDQDAPKGENVFRYCDPQVDAGERAGLSTDDPVRRAAIYHRVERRIHTTVPYVPLYLLRRPNARSVDLKGFDPAPTIAPWWNAYAWSI